MNIPSGLLKVGSKGKYVTDLQRELKDAGFDPHGIDGQFGPKTQAALKAFQKAKHLQVDGVAGKQTWTALGGDRYEDAKPTKPPAKKPSKPGRVSNRSIQPNLRGIRSTRKRRRTRPVDG